MSLKERLVQSQKEAGLSNYKLAQILGISKSTIASYLSGSTKPPSPYLDAIAKALGVDREWLTTGKGDKLIIGENPKSESMDVYSRLKESEARCKRYEGIIDTLTKSIEMPKLDTQVIIKEFEEKCEKILTDTVNRNFKKLTEEFEGKMLRIIKKDRQDL